MTPAQRATLERLFLRFSAVSSDNYHRDAADAILAALHDYDTAAAMQSGSMTPQRRAIMEDIRARMAPLDQGLSPVAVMPVPPALHTYAITVKSLGLDNDTRPWVVKAFTAADALTQARLDWPATRYELVKIQPRP